MLWPAGWFCWPTSLASLMSMEVASACEEDGDVVVRYIKTELNRSLYKDRAQSKAERLDRKLGQVDDRRHTMSGVHGRLLPRDKKGVVGPRDYASAKHKSGSFR